MSIKDLFISFWQLITKVIIAKKAKVLFYYPQHFNRTAQATNPFLDRLLETCDKYGINYQVIEEPDWGTDKPRNPRAIKGDALFVLITIIRKIVSKCGMKDDISRERITANVVNILTLGRLRHEKYITISGSMLELFLYLNRTATVYDMQHGVLFKQHPTFFDNKEHIRPHIASEPRWHWLMWGKGYEECFCRGDEAILAGRTHVVGYPIASGQKKESDDVKKVVLVSLQFTHDSSAESLQYQKEAMERALELLRGKDVKVLLKHHPRFNDAISIDDWKEMFPFCELTRMSMADLRPRVMLHVTFTSTTSFEYAEFGVPSYFVIDSIHHSMVKGDLFYSEYHYPLYQNMTLVDVVMRLQDKHLRLQDAETVRSWYREFYDEFDEKEFLKIIED